MKRINNFILFLFFLSSISFSQTTEVEIDSLWIATNYDKFEYRIEMRDGVTLFTAVYSPKDKSETYPIMLLRTPYSVDPYGGTNYPSSLGPSDLFAKDKFIFVYQDVRGKFMSEGNYVNMRPMNMETYSRNADVEINESTDTYDTINWLINNVENNNGKVGMWGISYPGFYTAAALIDAHPALVCASPQAPIANWWYDDFHHHGAFFLPHAFNFFAVFGYPQDSLTTEWGERFKHGTPDGYKFFLKDLGPLKNANEKYFNNEIPFWNEIVSHPNYDEFWQARNLLPHLNNIHTAVLTVGGWFDAEDLYGAINIYKTIEKQNPEIKNKIVMGPWRHGGWARDKGTYLGNVWFGDNPESSVFYREYIEFPFFKYYLKDEGKLNLPEAYMFETGSNIWRRFDNWPPENIEKKNLYIHSNQILSFEKPEENSDAFDEYISYPDKPVPYTEEITTGMTREYMTDDQRFASRRPDVLYYQTEPLKKDLTLAGPVIAKLKVSTSETAADWVVKLIDVYPDDHPPYPHQPKKKLGGYQQMVRSEIIRGRFRNSAENPEPFVPNEITQVILPLQDVLHTFKKGHRIMVQIQSTWFPLVDRNPQKYVENIFEVDEEDFIKATHRVHRSKDHPTYLEVGILK